MDAFNATRDDLQRKVNEQQGEGWKITNTHPVLSGLWRYVDLHNATTDEIRNHVMVRF